MKKSLSVYFLVLVFLFSFVSCSKKSETSLQTGAGRINKITEEIKPQAKAVGEPVPGAEIYVELEPHDDTKIDIPTGINVTTKRDGSFEFIEGTREMRSIPETGTFVFNINPTKETIERYALDPSEKHQVRVNFAKSEFKAPDGIKTKQTVFRYFLEWEWKKPTKEIATMAENKGAFAVSGKNST